MIFYRHIFSIQIYETSQSYLIKDMKYKIIISSTQLSVKIFTTRSENNQFWQFSDKCFIPKTSLDIDAFVQKSVDVLVFELRIKNIENFCTLHYMPECISQLVHNSLLIIHCKNSYIIDVLLINLIFLAITILVLAIRNSLLVFLIFREGPD